MTSFFHKIAAHVSRLVGSPYAFLGAFSLIIMWLVSGPAFGYSDTWQLIINTSTTIVTFLMVFLIQNTQNRDSLALHLKLDELIRATRGARNSMIDLDKLSDEQLRQLELEFARICTQCEPQGDDSQGDDSQRGDSQRGDSQRREPHRRRRRHRQGNPARSAEQDAAPGAGRTATPTTSARAPSGRSPSTTARR